MFLNCDLCEDEIKSKSEMKRHMKTHSYKLVNYQCKECTFFCESEHEMEVHIGKKHSDKFECGLCGFETKDIKYLNVHLRTCERYKCEHCEQKFATLSDVKIHLESFKLGLDLEIFHLKQNRSDSEVIYEKSHYVKDLFPELSKK